MPYVKRDAKGCICEVRATEVAGEPYEFLPGAALELLEFIGAKPASDHGIGGLDQELIRVIEDVVNVLINKNVLKLTDLPAEAQHKLLLRQNIRHHMRSQVTLLDDDELL